MDFRNISKIRLASQQIAFTEFKSPVEIVRWMGGMQAQDYKMAKWAIGLRLPGTTDAAIENAFNKGEILRIHILRPTWHFIAAEDIYWMLELASPHMILAMRYRHQQMGLTEKMFSKSNSIIGKALQSGKHLTRPELMDELKKAKIPTDSMRSIHLMYRAELNGIVCSGIMRGKNQTYALLDERIKKTKKIAREEALAKLADRYFTSHCPASLEDFTWWSGLSVKDARQALEMIRNNFIPETFELKTYWLTNSFCVPPKIKSSFYLLPAFDELVVSYKDRSAVIEQEYYTKAFTANGIFRPVILLNGKVIGLWKRYIQKHKVILEAAFFRKVSKSTINSFKIESKKYGKFLEKRVEIKE